MPRMVSLNKFGLDRIVVLLNNRKRLRSNGSKSEHHCTWVLLQGQLMPFFEGVSQLFFFVEKSQSKRYPACVWLQFWVYVAHSSELCPSLVFSQKPILRNHKRIRTRLSHSIPSHIMSLLFRLLTKTRFHLHGNSHTMVAIHLFFELQQQRSNRRVINYT
jgi:hypothetical protein